MHDNVSKWDDNRDTVYKQNPFYFDQYWQNCRLKSNKLFLSTWKVDTIWQLYTYSSLAFLQELRSESIESLQIENKFV